MSRVRNWREKVGEVLRMPGVKMVMLIAIPVIVILVMILIYMLNRPEVVTEPRIAIDNFSEVLPEVPEETRSKIEEELYVYVSESGVSAPTSGAMIRPDTVEGFVVSDSLHVGDFVVDIASVEQSYIAEYFYGRLEGMNEVEREASAVLYCIEKPELARYPDFRCRANRDFVKPDAIEFVLPKAFEGFYASYTYSVTSASGYAVVVEYDPSEAVYKNGRVEAYKAEKMAELRDYLEKAGLNPDDYEYIEKFKVVR